MDHRQEEAATRRGLEPQPRNVVDATLTSATGNPGAARSTLNAGGCGLFMAGFALVALALWYSAQPLVTVIAALAGVGCLVAGAILTSGVRNRLGQRPRFRRPS